MLTEDCACTGSTLGKLLKPAVMALLSRQPLHGYRIVHQLGEMKMMKGQSPDPAGVYRLLKSLEEDGLVESAWEAGGAGPNKREFKLTADGRGCLTRWKVTLREYSEGLGDLLATMESAGGDVRPAGKSMATLPTYTVDGGAVDSLDLKVLLLTQGLFVPEEVYKAFGATHRLSPDPMECSVLFLQDKTVVHIANIGPAARFQLGLGGDGELRLLHDGQFVTHVDLPPASAFYRQTTSRGVPFKGLAVLQGHDVLAFPYLWPCEFAKAGQACRFCHCGAYTQQQATMGIAQPGMFTAQDVAEVVHYAVNVEKCAKYVQLTGGSTFQTDGEYGQIVDMLQAIDRVAGLANIPGEIILYTTPAEDVQQVDQLFAAGVDRIACDIEIWDENLAKQICPGKYKWTGRQRHLDTLRHIAKTHGRNKACSTFVVGLEPAESFLAGAEELARDGIVPIPSIWMPHGLPPIAGGVVADMEFFRRVRRGLAKIYCQYGCEPPGTTGFNVCLCRDTWNNREAIAAAC